MSATNSILREIRTAYRLYQLLGPAPAEFKALQPALTAYLEAIATTQGLQQELGVAAACAHCATTALGSCCFAGVEQNYDPLLLLLNLLAGRDLPTSPLIPGKCFFLGPSGCRLLARHYYCQRFLCPELQEQLGPQALARLEAALMAELRLGLALEELLRPWLLRITTASVDI